MNLEVITDYVKEYCPEFAGKDNVNLFTVLYALAEEREANKKHREFLLSIGSFLGKNEILGFCTDIGTASDDKNGIYLKFLSGMNGCPAVACEKTGKTFLFSWDSIARLAVRCGVADDKKAN